MDSTTRQFIHGAVYQWLQSGVSPATIRTEVEIALIPAYRAARQQQQQQPKPNTTYRA